MYVADTASLGASYTLVEGEKAWRESIKLALRTASATRFEWHLGSLLLRAGVPPVLAIRVVHNLVQV